MDSASFWLPEPASTVAAEIDWLFYFILYTSTLLFALVVGLMIFFGVKYRRRGKDVLTTSKDHNTALEIIWTVIPTIVIMFLFVAGFRGYITLRTIPHDATQIKVTAQKWSWTFDYPDGVISVNNLVVPVNSPIKLLMSSTDVIHSFFVPAFRIKMDVLPNRYTLTWFEANRTGEFDLYCTEYCGKGHSEMIGKVTVMTDADYADWLEKSNTEGEGMPLKDYGQILYTKRACVTCHSIDGSDVTGPSFLGRYGTELLMTDGSRVLMDENYMRESILDPKARIANGYEAVMPTFQGALKDRQIDALIAYIKSLNE